MRVTLRACQHFAFASLCVAGLAYNFVYSTSPWSLTIAKTAPHAASMQCDMFDDVCKALQCVGNPCVVKQSRGTDIPIHEAAAATIKEKKIRVVVDGSCVGGCVLTLDLAYEQVCLTPKAVISFTKWLNKATGEEVDPLTLHLHSILVTSLVKQRGGIPSRASEPNHLDLTPEEAQKIWNTCPPGVPPARLAKH
jgi:hypothetical protein